MNYVVYIYIYLIPLIETRSRFINWITHEFHLYKCYRKRIMDYKLFFPQPLKPNSHFGKLNLMYRGKVRLELFQADSYLTPFPL